MEQINEMCIRDRYAPTYYAELCSMLYQAIYVDPGAVAIRYPRGGEPNPPEGYQYEKEP